MRSSGALRAALMLALACGLAPAPVLARPAHALPVERAVAIRVLPHDPQAFTEGLFIDQGELFESTGGEGRSSIRRVDLETGKVLDSVAIPAPLFGEGIAPWNGTILSLTWRNGVGYRWSRAGLKAIGGFSYDGEGWALTGDGAKDGRGGLVMSDGTEWLRFVDPASFRVTRRLRVTALGRPVPMLNELEWVDGEILANVWLTDRIARIDPASGRVKGWIDLAALHRRAGVTGRDQVANGIAWDAGRRRLYVTGKEWPVLFEIAPPKGR